jgi:hypothetical protein
MAAHALDPESKGVQTPCQHLVQPQGQRKEAEASAMPATYRCTSSLVLSMRAPQVDVVEQQGQGRNASACQHAHASMHTSSLRGQVVVAHGRCRSDI